MLLQSFGASPNVLVVLNESGHATGVSATVMGKYVRAGTTGKVNANVALPPGTPSGDALWAYLAKTVRVPGQPFGAHTFHDQLVA